MVPRLTIHKPGGYAEDDVPAADTDSGGWPQSARTRAVRSLAQADARGNNARLKGFPPETFDRVLLDPPCSALGLRPRLDLGSKASMADLEGHRDFARNFMWCAVRLLKPGGTLVFSTCEASNVA